MPVESGREGIPDFQTLMLPVLEDSAKGEVRVGATVERLADRFGLTPEQRADLLPSKRQTTFANRIHWAKSYLGKAGLIELTKRGHFAITDAGRGVLSNPPERIDIAFLKRFPPFLAFRSAENAAGDEFDVAADQPSTLTPDERMRQARDQIEADLAQDILSKLVAAPPEFFEKVVVKLLTAMGYGGSVTDAGRALGRSGDGGVDGVIDEDALGLDRIYVQAKRYSGSAVGAGAIRDFFGALDQFKAGKGLFVTTSTFSASAVATAAGLSKRIVLIDGAKLAQLMIRYEVGCRVEEELFIKKLDEEFFDG